MRTTVYPSIAGGFPPASFTDYAAQFDYVRQVQEQSLCGICICPAGSYAMHYPDTFRYTEEVSRLLWLDAGK